MRKVFGAKKAIDESGEWEERRRMWERDGGLPWAMLPSWVCLAPVWAQLPVGTNHGGLAALRGSWQLAHAHTSTQPHSRRHAYTHILLVHAQSHTHAHTELHWGQLALLINFSWVEESGQLTDLIKSPHTQYCCYCYFANIPNTYTHTYNPSIGLPPPTPSSAWSLILHNCPLQNGKILTVAQDRGDKQGTFGAEETRREAITVMCPLPSLRTPLPLDFRKLQLDSSKAIKLSTDKNKRMFFFHSLLFLCLFIPLSPFCSSPCPLPYPPLGLRALPNLSRSLPLALSRSLSLSGHCPPPHPPSSCTNASPCLVVHHLLLDCCLSNIHQRSSPFSFLHAI